MNDDCGNRLANCAALIAAARVSRPCRRSSAPWWADAFAAPVRQRRRNPARQSAAVQGPVSAAPRNGRVGPSGLPLHEPFTFAGSPKQGRAMHGGVTHLWPDRALYARPDRSLSQCDQRTGAGYALVRPASRLHRARYRSPSSSQAVAPRRSSSSRVIVGHGAPAPSATRPRRGKNPARVCRGRLRAAVAPLARQNAALVASSPPSP
jgi:hypothetical protein